jgi:hypothetical protein
MYADPLSVTVAGNAKSLARTGSSMNAGEFQDSTGEFRLSVSHSYGKRTRRTIRLQQNVISADPLLPSVNTRNFAAAYLVVDHPVNGMAVADVKALADAIIAFLAASSGAKVTQLLGGES